MGWGLGEGGAGDGVVLGLVVGLDLAGEVALAFLGGDGLRAGVGAGGDGAGLVLPVVLVFAGEADLAFFGGDGLRTGVGAARFFAGDFGAGFFPWGDAQRC